jgi:hypothetical protein
MHSDPPTLNYQGLWLLNVCSSADVITNISDHYPPRAHLLHLFSFLYADPTPNALQVFLSQPAVLNDAGIAPVPASDTSGLAPSAAAALAMTQEKAETAALMRDMDDIIKNDDLPQEEGDIEGVWVSADPLPGYVVCNIGESK